MSQQRHPSNVAVDAN